MQADGAAHPVDCQASSVTAGGCADALEMSAEITGARPFHHRLFTNHGEATGNTTAKILRRLKMRAGRFIRVKGRRPWRSEEHVSEANRLMVERCCKTTRAWSWSGILPIGETALRYYAVRLDFAGETADVRGAKQIYVVAPGAPSVRR